MNIYKKWQNNENSEGKRLFALVIGALIFPIGIPAILVILLPQVDKIIGIESFYRWICKYYYRRNRNNNGRLPCIMDDNRSN